MNRIELRPPREQVAAEGGDADGGYDRAPGREEEPCGVGEKRITEGHDGRSIIRVLNLSGVRYRYSVAGVRRAREASRRAASALLLRGRRSLVHVALHAGFMLGY
jgi:hypothetical protein